MGENEPTIESHKSYLTSEKRSWKNRVRKDTLEEPELEQNHISITSMAKQAIVESGVLSISKKTQEMRKMKQETVTHNGSCGAGTLAIGLCLAIIENRYSPPATAKVKLLESWNTTYPSRQVKGFDELVMAIKQTVENGNTQDMENLIGPVIRVYIGIAMQQQEILHDEKPFVISLDEKSGWNLGILTDNTRESIRHSVGEAAELEKSRFFDEMCVDVLSYGYYLYDQDLSTIARELLGMQLNRIMSISKQDFRLYQDIDSKLKSNHEIICSYASRHDVEIEHCSTYTANPSLIKIKDCTEPLVGHYTVDITSNAYYTWMKTKGIINDIVKTSDLDKIEGKLQKAIGYREYDEHDTIKKTLEEELYNQVEISIAQQINSGETRFYIDRESNDSNVIDIVHSNEIFWDSLINVKQAARYSRSCTEQKFDIDDITAYTRLGKKSPIALEKIWNDGIQCLHLFRDVFAQVYESISNKTQPLVQFSPNQLNPLDYLMIGTLLLLIMYSPSIASLCTGGLFLAARYATYTLTSSDQTVKILTNEMMPNAKTLHKIPEGKRVTQAPLVFNTEYSDSNRYTAQ